MFCLLLPKNIFNTKTKQKIILFTMSSNLCQIIPIALQSFFFVNFDGNIVFHIYNTKKLKKMRCRRVRLPLRFPFSVSVCAWFSWRVVVSQDSWKWRSLQVLQVSTPMLKWSGDRHLKSAPDILIWLISEKEPMEWSCKCPFICQTVNVVFISMRN